MLLLLLIFIILIFIAYKVSGGRAQKPGFLYLGEDWFKAAAAGDKTVDLRPGGKDKYKELVGKNFTYYHGNDEIKVNCVKIIHYNTLEDVFKKESLKLIAPHFKTEKEIKDSLSKYYTDSKIKDAGGINIIHFKLVKK